MGRPVSRVGTQFGPYTLRRLLGRGGMGEVYEAYDTVKDRVVALKLMTQDLSADPVFRQRMQREAQTAGRPRHSMRHTTPARGFRITGDAGRFTDAIAASVTN
jgi:serine/threonine protein kinase